jgi:hypothetical protein
MRRTPVFARLRIATAAPLALTVLVVAVLAGCSDDAPEPTTAELLAGLEGRPLTPAEVAQREQVADLLCGLDESVLREVWDRLDRRQLEFQDFVFSRQCPERNALYAQVTGRFAVEDTGD